MRYLTLVIFLLVSTMGFAQETPSSLRDQGLAAMKAAQSDPDQIVLAAKLLTQAADGFVAAGKEAEAEEMNACLFWAKKKMTIQQIDAFLGKGNGTAKSVVAKMEAVEKKEVKPEDAGKWLAKADGYAEAAKDPFLAAVRYFEVASRFKGSPEGDQALEKTLKFLQQAKVAVPVGNKVVGAAVKGDGKVYVQSNPVGASILVEAEDGLRDTGSKTPAMVQLPKGPAKLVLQKDKYEDAKVSVSIGDAIVKPDVVKLSLPKVDVEILSAEAGWRVFLLVDNKPVALSDKTGKGAETPCTVGLEEGVQNVVIAKEGFVDQSKRVTAGKDSTVAFDQKGRVGASRVIAFSGAEVETQSGKIDNLQKGKLRFLNRTYVWEVIPTQLQGKRYILSTIESSDVSITQSGTVFVLTHAKAPNTWGDSLEQQLESSGWTRAFQFKYGPNVGNVISVMQKNMKAGEKLSLGKWGIICF